LLSGQETHFYCPWAFLFALQLRQLFSMYNKIHGKTVLHFVFANATDAVKLLTSNKLNDIWQCKAFD